jgi:mono/diheme cytochrome c family protein
LIRLLFALSPALFAAMALPQDQPAAPPMPADAATLVNPVHPTSESQAHARTLYSYDCAMCHGANGNGKGDLVADMQLTLKDLTDPASLANLKDGELFYIIKNGKGKMPPEAGRVKDDDIWNMVIYVRSLAKK